MVSFWVGRFRRFVARGNHPVARVLRGVYKGLMTAPVPAPKLVVVPALYAYLGVRNTIYYVRRRFIAEPLFKAYCAEYGKRLRTGVFVHWVSGHGRIRVGDDVTFDGKCNIMFSSRHEEEPLLDVGDRTALGHNCALTVARHVSIGSDTRIAANVWIMDTPGHPSDPMGRLRNDPAPEKEVRPVRIGNNVWIGAYAMIFPGVTVGDHSVIAAGSVVMSDVPPNTVVAGNPARRIAALTDPGVTALVAAVRNGEDATGAPRAADASELIHT